MDHSKAPRAASPEPTWAPPDPWLTIEPCLRRELTPPVVWRRWQGFAALLQGQPTARAGRRAPPLNENGLLALWAALQASCLAHPTDAERLWALARRFCRRQRLLVGTTVYEPGASPEPGSDSDDASGTPGSPQAPRSASGWLGEPEPPRASPASALDAVGAFGGTPHSPPPRMRTSGPVAHVFGEAAPETTAVDQPATLAGGVAAACVLALKTEDPWVGDDPDPIVAYVDTGLQLLAALQLLDETGTTLQRSRAAALGGGWLPLEPGPVADHLCEVVTAAWARGALRGRDLAPLLGDRKQGQRCKHQDPCQVLATALAHTARRARALEAALDPASSSPPRFVRALPTVATHSPWVYGVPARWALDRLVASATQSPAGPRAHRDSQDQHPPRPCSPPRRVARRPAPYPPTSWRHRPSRKPSSLPPSVETDTFDWDSQLVCSPPPSPPSDDSPPFEVVDAVPSPPPPPRKARS